MEGKNRFTPGQINKALKLLRDLPIKDGRKSMRETLLLLEQGMRDALDKGYSRGEIRQQIAEAEIIIAATTLKSFLVEGQKEAGQAQAGETAQGSGKIGPNSEGEAARKTQNTGRKQDGGVVGAKQEAASGSKEPDNGSGKIGPYGDDKTVSEPDKNGPNSAEEMAGDSGDSSREQPDTPDSEEPQVERKQYGVLPKKVSPGGILIKPDTPRDEL